ncbi:hypothetical protein J23TS9_10380 [Paenibacillus sp. J23TS9]|uniref:hypothetical protein n=1 Tax=Paenibacillus sp. J23TS9 TaxID=2807193 RepID=UPI001B15AE00|nr:hypothetical protein [Paenibacillus sp. J23TS9]GIP25908.1 hypothetical protein J23TS9_10380 [Paenibacillus sp. J23TS9]
MNENMRDMITLSITIALFLGACFFTLGLTSQIRMTLHEAVSVVGGQKRSVHSTLKPSEPDVYSGPQALLIVVDSEVRIQADGVTVTHNDPVALINQSIFQADANYRAVYIRDIHGDMTEIQFYKLPKIEESS